MKKLIFTTLSLLAVGSAFAQQMIDNRNAPKYKAANDVITPSQKAGKALGKDVISDWYSPLDWAEGAGAAATNTTFVQFLMPDSLCKIIDDGDTIRRFYNISYGQIVDPKDDNIDLGSNPGLKLNKYTGYTVDSINLVYIYVRNVDTQDDGNGNMVDVVDTLVINYFTIPNQGITKGTLTGGQVFATPSWSIPTLKPTKMIASQKIPLTRDDSTSSVSNNGGFENSWFLDQKSIAVPAGVNVASKGTIDNIVGYTINFKLGHAYDTNSVIIYQKDPIAFPFTGNRANYFGYRFSSNEGTPDQQVKQTKFYNNSLISGIASAYGNANSNGWTGYIPGNAFFKNQYAQTDVFLSSLNTGLKNINNDQFALTNVYPNPAQVGGTAVLGFNLKNNSTVNIDIYNIAGLKVKSVVNKTYTAGEHAEEFDLAGLKAGIYLVNMNVNGATITKKLTITE